MTTSLEELAVGARAAINQIRGGAGLREHVQALGLETGQVLRKLQHAGKGPVLIEFGTQRVSIGRGIARKIMVEVVSDGS